MRTMSDGPYLLYEYPSLFIAGLEGEEEDGCGWEGEEEGGEGEVREKKFGRSELLRH